LTPSLDVAERFDDNIFLTARDRTSDFITEITPGLLLEYQSDRFNLSVSYAVVAQYYAETTDLNNFGDNQRGLVILGYRATPDLTLNVSSYYVRTNDTTDLIARPVVPETVVVLPTSESERAISQQYTLNANARYRFDARTTGIATYAFGLSDQEDTPTSYSNSVGLGVLYDLTALDSLSANAIVSLYTTSGESDQVSYSLPLGWIRRWSPSLTTSLALGPQVTDGDVGATGTASVAYQLTRELSASLAYSYGTGLVVGEVGPQQTSSLSGSLVYQPHRDLHFALSGAWTKSFPIGGSFDEGTDAYVVAATARYQVTRWLSTYLTYQFSQSEGDTGESVPDNQVILGVTIRYPFVL
jgi:predicted porin